MGGWGHERWGIRTYTRIRGIEKEMKRNMTEEREKEARKKQHEEVPMG